MRTLLLTLPVLGTIVFAAPAKAEHPADAAAAQALFERGRNAAQHSDWQAACDAFAESERLDPGAGTLMNWATCEAHQNKVASAWGHFNEAAALLAAGDDRTPFVRAQIRSLARRLPRLTVRLSKSTPHAARVLRDGTELGATSLGLPLPVDPGAVELTVTCAGHQPRRWQVELHEAEQLDITLETGEELVTTRLLAPPAAAPRNTQRDLGLTFLATGTVGVGVGIASSLVVASRKSTAEEHCPSHRCDDAGFRAAESGGRWLVVNTVAWSVGAAAVIGGAALLFTAADKHRDASLQPLPGGAAFVFAEHY